MRYLVDIRCLTLRAKRVDRKISLLALSQATGIYPQDLSAYENGRRIISPAHISRLCFYFTLDYEQLFPEHPDQKSIACLTLRKNRLAKNWCQEYLGYLAAHALGKPLSAQNISAYECGRWLASPPHIVALSSAFDLHFSLVFPEIVR